MLPKSIIFSAPERVDCALAQSPRDRVFGGDAETALAVDQLGFTVGIITTLSFRSKQVERTITIINRDATLLRFFDTGVQQQRFELCGGMPRPSLSIASLTQGRRQAVVRHALEKPVTGNPAGLRKKSRSREITSNVGLGRECHVPYSCFCDVRCCWSTHDCGGSDHRDRQG
jgi:hypothetical protein